MKLFCVYEAYSSPYIIETNVYVLCDSFGEAEKLFLAKYPDKKIDRVGVQLEEVIIKGWTNV